MCKPDPKLKGVKGGNCNVTACQKPGAVHRHKHMNMYAEGVHYCTDCAEEINRVAKRFGDPIHFDEQEIRNVRVLQRMLGRVEALHGHVN